ncbi:MAG TPA: hypothetical protein VFH51_21030, partial [Myxococcota bacterium]|nr:hypothetical protein [Myxococcota bacterium]
HRVDAQVVRVFAGGFVTCGATGVGFGQLFHAGLLGSLPGVAVASLPILFWAVPTIAAFGAGIAGWQAVRVGQSYRVQREIASVREDPMIGFEGVTETLLRRRLRERRLIMGLSVVSHAGIAVGAPLTLFVGPIGLSVLIPSALLVFAGDKAAQHRIQFPSQLSAAEKGQLVSRAAFVNLVAKNRRNEQALEAVRKQKALLYPRGSIYGGALFAEGWAALRRRLHPERVRALPPARTLLGAYFDSSLVAEEQFVRGARRIARRDLKAARGSAAWGRSRIDAIRSLGEDVHVLRKERARLAEQMAPGGDALASLRAVHRFILRDELLTPYAQGILADPLLHASFEGGGVYARGRNHEVDLDAITARLAGASDGLDRDAVVERLLCLAERVYMKEGRQRWTRRRKETLDLLSAYLTRAREERKGCVKPRRAGVGGAKGR